VLLGPGCAVPGPGVADGKTTAVPAAEQHRAAAARFMGPDGSTTDQRKVNRLLDRGDANVNRGSNLISTAVVDGSFIRSPG
jgi:hypothetical protein